MPAFNFTALNNQGKITKGIVEADSERQARTLIRSKQLKPIEVQPAHTKNNAALLNATFFSPRISTRDLALFTRQLATLIQSNLPLDEALSATAQHARSARIKRIILQVRSRVVEGHSLAYGLGDFPRIFNDMYIAMVRAGEHAGFLGVILEQLADYTERTQNIQQKLKTAMIYPVILIILTVVVIAALMVFVVPKMIGLFKHSKTDLPPLTEALIATSHFMENYSLHLLASIILIIFSFRKTINQPNYRIKWHQLLLATPLLGNFFIAIDTARFASTLSILVKSGVPLLEGLKIAGNVMNNMHLRAAAQDVTTAVGEGGSLNKALWDTGLFPPLMVHMVASGETSGELETMLSRAADNQERDVEMTLSGLMAIIEPVMVVIMASVVLIIVLAILLPIIQMNTMVG